MNDTLHVEMQDSDLLEEIGLMAALMVAASETEGMLSQEAIRRDPRRNVRGGTPLTRLGDRGDLQLGPEDLAGVEPITTPPVRELFDDGDAAAVERVVRRATTLR